MDKYTIVTILLIGVCVGIITASIGISPIGSGLISGLIYLCFCERIQKYLKTKF